jgi:hypothetical protein
VPGNELADRQARQVAASPTQPAKTLATWQQIKTRIMKHHQEKWNEEWQRETLTSQTTKKFFPTTESAKPLKTTRLPHQVIQILSGHSRLRTFLYRIGAAEDDLCACGSAETTEHFIYHCPRFSSERLQLKNFCRTKLKCWPPPLHMLTSSRVALRQLKFFIMSTNRLNFDCI